MKTIDEFDKRKEFKSEISPVIRELIKRCELNDIPVFVSCCVQSKPDQTTYSRDGIGTGSRRLKLYDDQIEKHMAVTCGFKVVPDINTRPDFDEEALKYIEETALSGEEISAFDNMYEGLEDEGFICETEDEAIDFDL